MAKSSQLMHARPAPSARSPRSLGFTLIEVMITVAIIAILAAVALPAYNGYIRRGQQAEAFNALSDFRAKMEQYYQDNRNYGSGNACATDPTAVSWNGFASTQYFSYTCVPTDTNAYQTYLLTATGSSGQVKGDVYRIDQNGNRTTAVFKGAAVTANCWLTKSSTC